MHTKKDSVIQKDDMKSKKKPKASNALKKSLFTKDTLFGHKVQGDRSKYKREHNYNIEVNNYE
jgi:hypothetical protein